MRSTHAVASGESEESKKVSFYNEMFTKYWIADLPNWRTFFEIFEKLELSEAA
jgi:hypothetical protein